MAKNIGLWHQRIVENKLAGIRAAHTKLVEFGIATKALGVAIDDKRSDAAGTRRRVGFGVDDINLRVRSVGNPHFIAGEPKVIAVGFGFQLHADNV